MREEAANVGFSLLHLAVVKKSSLTTKVRVVFDASRASFGRSLNAALKKGPTVQCSLFEIIMHAPTKLIIISADIEKMY